MKKEFIVNRSSSVTLNITAGKIDSYRKNEETTGTVRVYRDGKIGVAGMLGTPDEAALTERAEAALAAGIHYPDTPDTALVTTSGLTGRSFPKRSFSPPCRHAGSDRRSLPAFCPEQPRSLWAAAAGNTGIPRAEHSPGRIGHSALPWSFRIAAPEI